jgi:hypothetical protein
MAQQSQMEFDRPFRGKAPTTALISAASSAGFGAFSGVVPSLMAQAFSKERHSGENASILLSTANDLYDSEVYDGLAVCSQYPHQCGDHDGMFVDGAYTDDPGLALSIGEYQALEANDLSKTLKILLVDSAGDDGEGLGSDKWLNYFGTEQNRGVAPGGYLWPRTASAPIRSPQIFQESMSTDNLMHFANPVPGTNHTTLALKGTTIENFAYGVVAGQAVELFVILIANDNSIPDVLIGSDRIERHSASVADLAFEIASNQALVERVRGFFPVQTEAPTPSPQQPSLPVSSGVEPERWTMSFLFSLALWTIQVFF